MPTFATGKCLKGNQLEPDPQLQKSFELGCSWETGCWDFSFNELSGGVPKSISTSLTYIEVNDNKLSGHIPHQLGKLIKLQYLVYGPIPHIGGSKSNARRRAEMS
ncbi:leucine-rich repeat receptor-like protein kinase TDR isoform X3 [Capsicum annuum]|uniref:leucine-rich repeat receptor-like protein kinase TDR isoform X3 n=1 Tax=Capsicum annuum TaxID=4072 RepID=UPI001FB0C458|nr:leucine-rich repeat receptor-like protein kinase TDR isoform X3 [Capsicum annuum]